MRYMIFMVKVRVRRLRDVSDSPSRFRLKS
nr:MAG TPA: hypothetical protein [Caudoviricetes sp.]